MTIPLPDLMTYRAAFLKKKVSYPLPLIKADAEGLLHHLPAVHQTKTGWPWTEQTDPLIYDKKLAWPKLTIVTPSFNQAAFLEQTIRSVLLQNYPNLEYIVIDGGSTDGTLDILKKYAPWLSYWQSEKDAGQGNAINQGFSIASGAVYAWLNSDDYYLKHTFLKVMKKMNRIKKGFVYGYSLDYDHEKQEFRKINRIHPFYDYLIRIPSLAQPSCFWSADIHQPIWEELHCSLDYELWLRMFKGQARSMIKEPLSVATIHADAKTSNPKMKSKWQHDHELICSPAAHGEVKNWHQIVFVKRVMTKLYQWLHL